MQDMNTAPMTGETIWLYNVPGRAGRVRAYFRPGVPMEYRDAWVLCDSEAGTLPIGAVEDMKWSPFARPVLKVAP